MKDFLSIKPQTGVSSRMNKLAARLLFSGVFLEKMLLRVGGEGEFGWCFCALHIKGKIFCHV